MIKKYYESLGNVFINQVDEKGKESLLKKTEIFRESNLKITLEQRI